jgi:hypothetical protein
MKAMLKIGPALGCILLIGAAMVQGNDAAGVWTKTTDANPANTALFYIEENDLKAIGISWQQGKKVAWYAEGKVLEGRIQCYYHYSRDAVSPDWEQDGTMELVLSEDGNLISGMARSASGSWSGRVEFRRVEVDFTFSSTPPASR